MVTPDRIETILVQFDDADSSNPGSCMLCGGVNDPVELPYKFTDEYDNLVVRSTQPVPGSRCRDCDAEWLDGKVSLVLDKATLPLLNPKSPLREALSCSIARLEIGLKQAG
ncbi:hypothetical protein KKE03_02000 [Patescibacteria group bacterium]|nr:hypothetical protein [Patescibacteria group bacterium]